MSSDSAPARWSAAPTRGEQGSTQKRMALSAGRAVSTCSSTSRANMLFPAPTAPQTSIDCPRPRGAKTSTAATPVGMPWDSGARSACVGVARLRHSTAACGHAPSAARPPLKAPRWQSHRPASLLEGRSVPWPSPAAGDGAALHRGEANQYLSTSKVQTHHQPSCWRTLPRAAGTPPSSAAHPAAPARRRRPSLELRKTSAAKAPPPALKSLAAQGLRARARRDPLQSLSVPTRPAAAIPARAGRAAGPAGGGR
mmetsp:Transcript_114144/g.333680  ORF Transcript_114144/g.333680 Transcript_114144/m.333680 type:complete len:254 (+) Transcript_114144:1290-2051(+)